MAAPMSELAYRHPKRGKAHRERPEWFAEYVCGTSWAWETGLRIEAVPVEQVDPADLCKRCWPGRAS